MEKRISFKTLREVKDALPDGSMEIIAQRMGVSADAVRNFFGGRHYADKGSVALGFHLEPGPDGGFVILDDSRVFDIAWDILQNES